MDFNKIDEKDFVFINKTFKPEEERAFSDFLVSRKKTVGVSDVILQTLKVPRSSSFSQMAQV